MAKNKRRPSGTKCTSCKTVLQAGAKFCHDCGAPVGGQAPATQRNWKGISLVLVAAVAVSFGLVLVVGKFVSEKTAVRTPQQAAAPRPSASTAPSVDLSTMTARQAADRLFNRVMAADERGDSKEAMRFAPMTLQAYELVERLDLDGRFHVGLINVLYGDIEAARAQIDALQKQVPDHLLALVLSAGVAEKLGDETLAAASRARFLAAYEAEIKSGRPEYEAHGFTIEEFRAADPDG